MNLLIRGYDLPKNYGRITSDSEFTYEVCEDFIPSVGKYAYMIEVWVAANRYGAEGERMLCVRLIYEDNTREWTIPPPSWVHKWSKYLTSILPGARVYED